MNVESLLLDLSHASEATFYEAIEMTELPPIVSHTGARGVFDTWRNLSDRQIQEIASRDGVIGVMLAPPALAASDLEEVYRHIEHIRAVGGDEVLALGSDYDGYVTPPFGVDQLPRLTQRLVQAGWSDERIKGLLGENVLAVLEARELHRLGRAANRVGVATQTPTR